MARTDKDTGAELQELLKHASFNQIRTRDLYDALNVGSSYYHKRVKEPDYPTAEEIDLIAARLDTQSFGPEFTAGALKVRFGLIDQDQVREMEEYLKGADHPTRLATKRKVGRKRSRFKSFEAHPDAPPV